MAAPDSALPALLRANRSYMLIYHRSGLTAPPQRRLAVITCMDARLNVEQVMGLRPGDAHIIRNAGGLATDDALRSLALSVQALGVREVVIIEHTECGLLNLQEDSFKERVARTVNADLSGLRLLPFADLHENLRRQVETVRQCPWITKEIAVHGLVFHVSDGHLEQVV